MTAAAAPEPRHLPLVLTAAEAASHQAELARLKTLARRCLGPIDDRTPDARRDAEDLGREHAITTARIVELESMLRSAQILPSSAPPIVAVGVVVDVHYISAGRTVSYQVTAASLPPSGSVSIHSPIGQALMGRGVGEQVEVELPSGRREMLRIEALAGEGARTTVAAAGAEQQASAATIRAWAPDGPPPL